MLTHIARPGLCKFFAAAHVHQSIAITIFFLHVTWPLCCVLDGRLRSTIRNDSVLPDKAYGGRWNPIGVVNWTLPEDHGTSHLWWVSESEGKSEGGFRLDNGWWPLQAASCVRGQSHTMTHSMPQRGGAC
jgi:hypothetical protein